MGFASGLTHLIVFPHARGKRCLAVDAAHAEVFDLRGTPRCRISSPSELADRDDAAFLHGAEGPISPVDLTEMMPSLMPTMPYSSPSATRQMRPMSRL